MLRPWLTHSDRHVPQMLGWLMLVGGMTLVGCAVLLPAWLEARQIKWHRDVMTLQHARMIQQEENYKQLEHALAVDDPAVLTRLAFARLRQIPVGSAPIGLATRDRQTGYSVRYAGNPNDAQTCTRLICESLDQPDSGSIESWLHIPMPRQGEDYNELPSVSGRIVRIASGRLRLPLAAAGVLWVAAGLIPLTSKS